MNKKIYSRNWRIRKAYWTAFVVMMRYVGLHLASKLWGKAYYRKRVGALHVKNADQIKKVILELQGLFIKIGQLLSILTNFLPPAFHGPLEALQDKIPSRPFEEIKQRIESELGKPIDVLFKSFESIPIAAASIGQAHKARLKDGTEVIVKVQHANIEEIAEVDLAIIEKLTKLTAWFMDIKGLEYAYTQVRKMIEEELDFKREAQSMQIIQANLKNEVGILIPQVHLAYSSHRVLTTTFCEGVKINDVQQLEAWQLNRTEIAHRLIQAYCQMLFRDGFYHADPHPGNIMVQSDGTIVLLDFGAVATLSPALKKGIPELIEAIIKNDTNKIIAVMDEMGFIAEGKDSGKMAEKMVHAFRNFLQNEVQIEGLNFKDIKVNPFETSLFNLVQDIGFKGIANTVQVPKDYVLLNRMVTLLMGICSTLDASMNPLKVVRPYLQEFMLGKQGTILEIVTDIIKGTTTNILSLPDELYKTLKQTQKGDIEIVVKGIPEGATLLYALGQQLIYTLLVLGAAGLGYLFFEINATQQANFSFFAVGIFGLLLFRAIRRGRRIQRKIG